MPEILKPININKSSKAAGNIISGAGKGIGNAFSGIANSVMMPLVIVGVVVIGGGLLISKNNLFIY